jgi:integrase
MATPKRSNRPKGEGSIYQHTDGRWMYSVMHAGKRLTKSLGTRDEEEAKKAMAKVRNNFLGRIDRGDLEPSTSASVKLDEILDEYLAHIRANRHKSARIIEGVLGKVRKATEFANRKVATLETKDFKSYRARLVKDGASHSTVNNHLAYVRAALKLETKQTPSRVGKVPYIPIVKVSNARQGFLEYDDHENVLDALPASLKALFIVAFHSGCRKGEVLNMRWSDVDWGNHIVKLPTTKSGKPRNLPFWGTIAEHLKRQKAYRDAHYPECSHLFFWMDEDVHLDHGGVRNTPGKPISNFRGSWANAVEEAHRLNPNVRAALLFHDLRRSAIRVMVQEAGIPESQAMLISGHETQEMLTRYNIVSLKNVQDAGAKLEEWRSKRSKSKTRRVVPIRGKRAKSA